MLRGALLAAAVALAGLTSATVTAPTCDATCQTGAVSLLLGRCASKRLPPACVDDLAAEASAFCSGFLSPVTVGQTTLVTMTQVQSVTATETATTTATDTTTSTTITVTTITDVATDTSTTVVSTSTTTAFAISMAVERRGARPTACPKLSTPRLQRLAPAKVSSVCSLLGVAAPTTTVTDTATSTAASTTTASTETATSVTTTTVVDVETTLVQTTTSITTTTTTSAVAVATQTVDACHSSRTFSGSGQVPSGHTVATIVAVPSAAECCRRCWTQNNCVVSVYLDGQICRLVTRIQPLVGASPSDLQCPLGRLPWARLASSPSVFNDGPCGIP